MPEIVYITLTMFGITLSRYDVTDLLDFMGINVKASESGKLRCLNYVWSQITLRMQSLNQNSS